MNPIDEQDFAIRALEMSVPEFAANREHVVATHEAWQQATSRIILLAAGVGAVVVPVLADRTQQASPSLRAGALWLFVCVAIGVVMQLVGRYLLTITLYLGNKHQSEFYAALGALAGAETSEQLEEARAKLGRLKRVLPQWYVGLTAVITIIGEASFYGCFLWGAWQIVQGFLANR